ncbi:helix-turn-helix domain-containing protein [Roseivirga pacifica]|uniref:helix-turn-helix domain-containing protein n=1 Tax=Roseivirga pacifica TaxID=1267423 RepID=UPI003BAD748D
MAKDDFSKEVLTKFAERLKDIRKAKGYSNYEYFAYEIGLNRAQYGRYERGEDIKLSTLAKVLKGFDITFEEFFSEGFD